MRIKPRLPYENRLLNYCEYDGKKLSFKIVQLSNVFSHKSNKVFSYHTLVVDRSININKVTCIFCECNGVTTGRTRSTEEMFGSALGVPNIGVLDPTPGVIRIDFAAHLGSGHDISFTYIMANNIAPVELEIDDCCLDILDTKQSGNKTYITIKITIEAEFGSANELYELDRLDFTRKQQGLLQAVIHATQNENETIAPLIQVGADVNAPIYEENPSLILCLGSMNINGRLIKNQEAALILLDLGADPHYGFGGDTYTLLFAVQSQSEYATKYLLEYGANPESVDSRNVSVLYVACQKGNLEIVKALIATGADPNKASYNGFYPLDVAITNDNPDVIRYLISINANKTDETIIPYDEIDQEIDNNLNTITDAVSVEEFKYHVQDEKTIEGRKCIIKHHPQVPISIIYDRIMWAITDSDLIWDNPTTWKATGMVIEYDGNQSFLIRSRLDDNVPEGFQAAPTESKKPTISQDPIIQNNNPEPIDYREEFCNVVGIKESELKSLEEKSKKGLLLTKDSLNVRSPRKDNKNTIIVIPEGVETIDKGAFKKDEVIEYILLPKSLKRIEDAAFERCKNLKYVGLPEAEFTFGKDVFNGTKQLTSIRLPEGAILGPSTFSNSNIESIVCKAKNGIIPHRCFAQMKSLKEVTLFPRIKEIGEMAFEGCLELKAIHIPKGVEVIQEDAFDTCLNLKITVEHPTKPTGWDENWNPSSRPVAWDFVWYRDLREPIYEQPPQKQKVIYSLSVDFSGLGIAKYENLEWFYSTDELQRHDRVGIKGSSKVGKVYTIGLAIYQRRTREKEILTEFIKV